MTFKLHNLAHEALSELLALTCSSNAQLYEQATGLGIFSADDIRPDGFHYHVKQLRLREQGGMSLSHAKRAQLTGERFSLAQCRLRSEPRLVFSARLVPFRYRAEGTGSASEFGVLASVQELCSGFMKVEMLETGCATREDLCIVGVERVAAIIAKTISLPKLKISALHLPAITYSSSIKASHTSGIIGAMLGYPQPTSAREQIERELRSLETLAKKGDWGGNGYRLRPLDGLDWCFADFPKVGRDKVLEMDQPCGRPWRLRTVSREINQRLDKWNTSHLKADYSPIIKLWLARIRYHKKVFKTEGEAKESLRLMFLSVNPSMKNITELTANAFEIYEKL